MGHLVSKMLRWQLRSSRRNSSILVFDGPMDQRKWKNDAGRSTDASSCKVACGGESNRGKNLHMTRSTYSTHSLEERRPFLSKMTIGSGDGGSGRPPAADDQQQHDHHADHHDLMPLSPTLRSADDHDWINMLPFADVDADLPPPHGEHGLSVGSEVHHQHQQGHGHAHGHVDQRHAAAAAALDDEMMAAAVAAAVAATTGDHGDHGDSASLHHSVTHAASASLPPAGGPKTTGEEEVHTSIHMPTNVTPSGAAAAGNASNAPAAAAGSRPALTQKAITSAARAQARSERKRSREKQRRSDVNAQFAGLTAVLRKIETDELKRRAEKEEKEERIRQEKLRASKQLRNGAATGGGKGTASNEDDDKDKKMAATTTTAATAATGPAAAAGGAQTANATGTTGSAPAANLGILDQIGRTGCPTNRTDLIARTIAVLERIHLSNTRLWEEVEDLREEVERQRRAGEELAAKHKEGGGSGAAAAGAAAAYKQPPPPPSMLGVGAGGAGPGAGASAGGGRHGMMDEMMMQKQQEKVCSSLCMLCTLVPNPFFVSYTFI